jgi:hypothetical protein
MWRAQTSILHQRELPILFLDLQIYSSQVFWLLLGAKEEEGRNLHRATTRTSAQVSSLRVWSISGKRSQSCHLSLQLFGLWRLVSSLLGLLSFCYEISAILFQISRSIVSRSSTTMNKIGSEVFLVIPCVVDLVSC